MSTSFKLEASPVWEPEFEHISWNDIVEADQEGDLDKLQSLKDKSLDLKRSMSCPEPAVGYGLKSSPVVPHSTPLSISNARPFQDWDDSEYPCLPSSQTSSTPSLETSPKILSYADALGPRVAKRTMADRTCLSPIDYLPKRSALSGSGKGHRNMNSRGTTQISPIVTNISEDVMDTGTTPSNDSRLNKTAVAVQRRLFAPIKENVRPCSTQMAIQPGSAGSSPGGKAAPSGHQVTQRQKQIEFGKNTLGYQRYIQTVPRWKRSCDDPWTPDKNRACSTRSWQGQMRVWRRALHKYDPPTHSESSFFTPEEAALCHMEIMKE